MKARFFLVRHGETAWNREGRFQGQRDVPLNERGIEQAEALARALKSCGAKFVWSSPLSRAKVTAEKIGQAMGLPVYIDDDLKEINHGLWEGRTMEEVKNMWPALLEAWHSQPHTVKMPDGEDIALLQARAFAAYCRISEHGEGPHVVVTHDAVMKTMLCLFLEMPLSGFWRFQLGNASVSIVEKTERGMRATLLGDTCHLGDPYFRAEQKGL